MQVIMEGEMQSKVVEVQTADATTAWSGKACDFGETTVKFNGGKSADCLSFA